MTSRSRCALNGVATSDLVGRARESPLGAADDELLARVAALRAALLDAAGGAGGPPAS